MNIEKLKQLLQDNKQPKFRLGQIQKAVYQDGVSSFSEITTLSKDLREILEKEMPILPFTVEKVLVAKDKQTIKALLRCRDALQCVSTNGHLIETVLISPKPGVWSACISCQVGCPNGCSFCATGSGGFKRNLTAEEITNQILFWKQYLSNNLKFKISNLKLTNVVYMGMGEPFLNWENVKASLELLTDKNLFGFGSRSISVSTSGIPDGIMKFAEDFPQMNLALSLHFADNETRSRYMPINRKYSLDDLQKVLQEYFTKSKRKVFIEYIMLAGINDSLADARKLADYLKSIGHSYLLHVNLIAYNTVTELDSVSESSSGGAGFFKSSSGNKIAAFKDCLEKNRISATIRKSLGEEIQGACGQLAGK